VVRAVPKIGSSMNKDPEIDGDREQMLSVFWRLRASIMK
jgi:hypothetical protein